ERFDERPVERDERGDRGDHRRAAAEGDRAAEDRDQVEHRGVREARTAEHRADEQRDDRDRAACRGIPEPVAPADLAMLGRAVLLYRRAAQSRANDRAGALNEGSTLAAHVPLRPGTYIAGWRSCA